MKKITLEFYEQNALQFEKNPNHFLPLRLNLLLKILTVESNGAKPAKSGYENS
jgi:hypothetical protein